MDESTVGRVSEWRLRDDGILPTGNIEVYSNHT